MNNAMLSYMKENTFIHKLTGATKLIFFILWAIAAMITYDTRFLICIFIFSFIIFRVSKVKFSDVSFVIYFILFFIGINSIFIFIFAPYQGVSIYGTRHNLFHIVGGYYLTKEQLFYQFNLALKYFSSVPMAVLFIVTTEPSEFAASLNKIGISYRIAYAVSITLRYIPDVQRDYQDISFAQQARGIDMSTKEKLLKRVKNSAAVLLPLIFSSLDRIETISCAMELRSFGNKKKRTWYRERKFTKKDYVTIFIAIMLFLISLGLNIHRGSRFYNPFV